MKCLNECFLSQNVFFKTFQQESTRLTNILDLIITEEQEGVYELRPGSVLGGKEHGHLSLSWIYKTKEKEKTFGDKFRSTKLNYKRGDYVGMNIFFENNNWVNIFEGKSIREGYRLFVNKYSEACEIYVPRIKESKRRIRPPWLSKELKSMMRSKQVKWCKFVSGG